jgi:L-threonylcarbamoyladenylate synthase
MKTEVVRVNPDAPEPEKIARAAELLRAGKLVAFPTETVYGLGANALDPAAVRRIFDAKGRPAANPLIVHVADAQAAREIAAEWPETASRLAARFWPGPLTLVLPKRDIVPLIVTAGGPTVAVRVPAHPVALALIQKAGVPVAAPSANRSARLSPTRAEHVLRGLAGRIEMLLDGGPTVGGLESTVLDLTTIPPRLLRPGPVSPADLESLIGPVARAQTTQAADGQPMPSPGMLARHYAPRAPLELAEDAGRERAQALCLSGLRVGWLRLQTDAAKDEPLSLPGLLEVPMPVRPEPYAAMLYAALHSLDDAGVDRILVQLPPDTEEWLAVRDRLRRAASPEGRAPRAR